MVVDWPTGARTRQATRTFLRTCGAGLAIAVGAANTTAQVFATGFSNYGQCDVPAPPAGVTYVEIAAGDWHTIVRRTDGVLAAWGNNASGQCVTPNLPPGVTYVEIAAGGSHSVARRSDGELVAWGANDYGQCDVPTLPAGVTYVEIAAGGEHTLARRSDGLVAAWGRNDFGQCNVTSLPAGMSYVEIAAGSWHSVARLNNGSVAAWGSNSHGQCDVPALPSGVEYLGVATGLWHTVAFRSDGLIVAWGDNSQGQCSPIAAPPASGSCVEVAGGWYHTVARYSNGEVRAWGDNTLRQCNPPALPPSLPCVEIDAGAYHTLLRYPSGPAVPQHTCRTGGVGGPIPAAGSGDGDWPNTLPSAPLVSASFVAIPTGATRIVRVKLDDLSHTWIGDTHITLEDPFGVEHTLLHRPGFAGTGYGNACPAFGDYSIVETGGSLVPGTCWGLEQGDYCQYFGVGAGAWPSGTGGIFNTPLGSIPMTAGIWTLRIYDWAADDTGWLVGWELCFDSPSGTSWVYCTAGTTSHGCVSSIGNAGTPSASAGSGFTISIANVEGERQGLIFYGVANSGFVPVSWGAGSSWLCVKAPHQRTAVQSSGGNASQCNGVLAVDWNAFVAASPTALGNPFIPGQHVFAQGWFRDPPSPKTTMLSDALEFVVAP